MGLYEHEGDGVLSLLAGRGRAEYGASTVRSGTVEFPATGSAHSSDATVTFADPMPDGNYIIVFHPTSGGYESRVMPNVYTQSASGFTARSYIIEDGTNKGAAAYKYTAFKLYTDNEYNGLLNNQRYSTDEIDTGKTWIDGKPIYRKVLEGTLSSTTETSIQHGISNLDYVVNAYGMTAKNNDGERRQLDFAYYGDQTWDCGLYVMDTTIHVQPGTNFSRAHGGKKIYVILEYTKTTD